MTSRGGKNKDAKPLSPRLAEIAIHASATMRPFTDDERIAYGEYTHGPFDDRYLLLIGELDRGLIPILMYIRKQNKGRLIYCTKRRYQLMMSAYNKRVAANEAMYGKRT